MLKIFIGSGRGQADDTMLKLVHIPDLHPVKLDRGHLVGVVLVQQRRVGGPRQPRRHDRLDHDHVDRIDQRGLAQGVLCQVH